MNTLTEKYTTFARAGGSTATTTRGLLRWMVKHRTQMRTVDQFRKLDWIAATDPASSSDLTAARHCPWRHWKKSDFAPKYSDDEREIRRARNDPKFRAKKISALKREAARLSKPETLVRDMQTLTHATRTRDTRVLRIHAVQKILTKISPRAKLGVKILPIPGVTVPIDLLTARKLGAAPDMRGRDATSFRTKDETNYSVAEAHYVWRDGGGVVDPKYLPQVARDGRAEYVRRKSINCIRSVALIDAKNDRIVTYIGHNSEFCIESPEGYSWSTDENGLSMIEVATGADYHPTAGELIVKNAAQKIAQTIAENRETRLRTKAQESADRAERAGVWVCVADASRAGNCASGILSFANRHGLRTDRHYRATELLRIANGDSDRVRLSITAATLRHRREIATGMCDISIHA